MRTYASKLTAAQIVEGKQLRADAYAWNAIATFFDVDVKTVRRACDPMFDRPSQTSHEPIDRTDCDQEHRARMHGDLKFKQRMLKVRKWGRSEAKHLVLGVVTSPCTQNPKFIDVRSHGGMSRCALADL